MFNPIRQEFQYGNQQVVLETGRIARQANSVLVHMGGVSVLVAVVVRPEAIAGQNFFPLTVNYQEKCTLRENPRRLWQSVKVVRQSLRR